MGFQVAGFVKVNVEGNHSSVNGTLASSGTIQETTRMSLRVFNFKLRGIFMCLCFVTHYYSSLCLNYITGLRFQLRIQISSVFQKIRFSFFLQDSDLPNLNTNYMTARKVVLHITHNFFFFFFLSWQS